MDFFLVIVVGFPPKGQDVIVFTRWLESERNNNSLWATLATFLYSEVLTFKGWGYPVLVTTQIYCRNMFQSFSQTDCVFPRMNHIHKHLVDVPIKRAFCTDVCAGVNRPVGLVHNENTAIKLLGAYKHAQYIVINRILRGKWYSCFGSYFLIKKSDEKYLDIHHTHSWKTYAGPVKYPQQLTSVSFQDSQRHLCILPGKRKKQ